MTITRDANEAKTVADLIISLSKRIYEANTLLEQANGHWVHSLLEEMYWNYRP